LREQTFSGIERMAFARHVVRRKITVMRTAPARLREGGHAPQQQK
jgi:hypothetical protein